MIEAPVLTDTIAPLSALMVRRKRPALLFPAPSRALVVIEEQPVSDWAADLRFFAICYFAGFIFFLIMLS
jgi:hypothetical protein